MEACCLIILAAVVIYGAGKLLALLISGTVEVVRWAIGSARQRRAQPTSDNGRSKGDHDQRLQYSLGTVSAKRDRSDGLFDQGKPSP